MRLKMKRLTEGPALKAPKPGDVGLDLYAVAMSYSQNYIEYDTGVAVEIPAGYVGLIYPRSSLSVYDMSLANSVGVIDQNYRGSIKVRFRTFGEDIYKVGDRVCQLVLTPCETIEVEMVDNLSDSNRGEAGFGSSGR